MGDILDYATGMVLAMGKKNHHLKKHWHHIQILLPSWYQDTAKFVLEKEKVLCVDWASHINDIIVNSWLFTSQMESKHSKAKQEMRNYYQKPWKKLALLASWDSAMNNPNGGYTWVAVTPIFPRVIASVVPGTCPWKPSSENWDRVLMSRQPQV